MKLTIGSRGSKLALTQTQWVKTRILERSPGLEAEIRIIRTAGDRDTTSPLRSGTTMGVFVKEIEEALIAGDIDLAVHSMKDLPTASSDVLEISAVPEREDARDALIAGDGIKRLEDLPPGARIGTGSVRRQAQLMALRGDLRVLDLRGNVDTRLRKLAAGDYEAIILACAGLKRLGLENRIKGILDLRQMLPAPGQGALALQTRRGDLRVHELLSGLHHAATAGAVEAERAFLRRMGGGCSSPIAVYAEVGGDQIMIEGLIASLCGDRIIRRSVTSKAAQAEQAGVSLAEQVLSEGGQEILRTINTSRK